MNTGQERGTRIPARKRFAQDGLDAVFVFVAANFARDARGGFGNVANLRMYRVYDPIYREHFFLVVDKKNPYFVSLADDGVFS